MQDKAEHRVFEQAYAPNTARSTQPLRKLVQYGFLALNVWIGILFYRFVLQLEAGLVPTVSRPPGVEGYLPISSLISLKYWLATRDFPMIHPSGLVLFLVFIAIAFLLKKGFCSWLCPVGLVSEHLESFKRRFLPHLGTPPPWLDYILRGIKYLLLVFFIWAIIIGMDTAALGEFIHSDYNKVADIKMMQFFTEISTTALVVILVLVLLSILIPYFWCRYLCPYGALLGFLSVFSPLNVKRKAATCIDCKACTQACPALITVHKMSQVSSDECHACYKCVDACPVNDTLDLRVTMANRRVPGWAYAAVIVGFFVLATLAAQVFGYWESSVTTAEYLELMPQLDDLDHTRGL